MATHLHRENLQPPTNDDGIAKQVTSGWTEAMSRQSASQSPHPADGRADSTQGAKSAFHFTVLPDPGNTINRAGQGSSSPTDFQVPGAERSHGLEDLEDVMETDNTRFGVIVGTNSSETVHGTAGNDTIEGYFGDDTIFGYDGDDTIYGNYRLLVAIRLGTGNNTISGGDGDDEIYGSTGFDSISGGNGNDTIVSDPQYLEGSSDTVTGGFGADVIHGGKGNDVLSGNGEFWTQYNNPYNDYWIRGYDGYDDSDVIYGDAGDDRINGNAGLDKLYGGDGNDTIFGGQNAGSWTPGTTRVNTIHLREGKDTIYGGNGNDFINGNMGPDDLYGGPGDDLIRGGQDTDRIDGGPGNDTIYGDLEGDYLIGGAGDDTIILGNSQYTGDGAVDTVALRSSDRGFDVIYGFESHDLVYINGVESSTQVAIEFGLAQFHLV